VVAVNICLRVDFFQGEALKKSLREEIAPDGVSKKPLRGEIAPGGALKKPLKGEIAPGGASKKPLRGEKMQSFMELEEQFLVNVYPKRKLTFVRAKGATIWDEVGKAYIDCISGHGVTNLGHGNLKVTQAITEQAQRMINCSNVFYNDSRAKLLEKLIKITPENLTRAFLCNSGAEAVEGALKFSRFTTKKHEFICAAGAFHGRTYGALSATFKKEYREPFAPLVPGFQFAPFNDFEKLEALATGQTAGIMLELIQGEGGIHVCDKEYLQKIQKLCRERNILFIVDEIQTGFGRAGTMFVSEQFGLEPDILCLAKAIANGIPMGAVVCSDKVEVPVGKHGTTSGGNPLACAAASATIDSLLDDDLPKQAAEKGAYFVEKLSHDMPTGIREIRGLGLMLGLELYANNMPAILSCQKKGLLVFPAGSNIIRVFPPLTISYTELDKALAVLREVLSV